jgi:DNA-binding Xre family transcriptional regulator
MTVSYKKLWHLLLDKGMTKLELAKRAEISRYSITKMGKDEDVSTDVLKKICDALHCRVEEIVDFIPEK